MTCIAALRSSRMQKFRFLPTLATTSRLQYRLEKFKQRLSTLTRQLLIPLMSAPRKSFKPLLSLISSTATTPTKSAVCPPSHKFASDILLWSFWFGLISSGQRQQWHCKQGILIADILTLWMTTAMLSIHSSCFRKRCHEAHSSLDTGSIDTIVVLSYQPLL